MTTGTRRLVVACGLVPTLFVTLLSVYRPAFLSGLEYAAHDALVRLAPARGPSDRIAIVDIDERSLSTIGQWPWRRTVMGDLIDRLRTLGAAVVALDVIFAESDRHEGSGLAPDLALAETLREGRVVLGYAMTFERGRGSDGSCVQHPVSPTIVRRAADEESDPFFEATGAVCNLPVLVQAAGASGFLNARPDPDGILRRAPVLQTIGGRIYPSLALAAVGSALNARPEALRIANVNTAELVFGDRVVPLDAKSNLLVRYRGAKGTFPYLSAADVLAGQVGADAVRNKIVFVGTTALGTREVVSTPLDTLFVGVEVHATIADNFVQRDFAHRPEHAVTLEALAVMALGLVATLVAWSIGPTWGSLAAVLVLGALWGAAAWWMSVSGAIFSPLYPSLAVIGAAGAVTVAGFTVERKRADRAGAANAASQRLMVQTLLSLTEKRDLETGRHSRRTQQYARVLAQALSAHPDYKAYLTPERIDLLATLAPLHDIGKVAIPDSLLNKPGRLTPEELAEMRKHPAHGRDVIVNAERAAGVRDDVTLTIAKDIVYTHHEKWDGTGYPEGIAGAAIPIPGRVMALVDVWDAILTRTLYLPPMSVSDATAFIIKGRGTHFDPAVVDAFVTVAGEMHRLAGDHPLERSA